MPALMRLVLVGCGGHASDVLGIIEACNAQRQTYVVLGYVDDEPTADDRRVRERGIRRLGTIEDSTALDACFVIGIGYPERRAAVAERVGRALRPAPPLVHPGAQISTGVRLGDGAVVFDNVGVGPLASVGKHVMVGRGATVGHDARVADYVSLMPGCVVSGDVDLGVGCLVGANATVLEGRSIGPWSRLGAGAVLTSDLPAGCTAVGVPARITQKPSS